MHPNVVALRKPPKNQSKDIFCPEPNKPDDRPRRDYVTQRSVQTK